jgi:hypothetical protein
MATRASRIALAGSNISSTGEVDADLLDNTDSSAFLSLDSNGRLGIGTSSPSRQLEIYDDGTVGQAVLALTAQNTDYSRIMFADPDDVNIGILDYAHSDNSMRFTVNNAERMRIDSSGNVGIGGIPTSGGSGARWLTLDTPSTNTYSGGILYKINGTTKAYHYVENDHVMHQTTSGMGQKFYAGSSVAMTLNSSGNLLVGNTSTGLTSDGINLHGNGTLEVRRNLSTANSSTVAYMSRGSSDGNIIQLYKDTTHVGSIGTSGGQSYIHGAGTDVGIYFGSNNLYPYRSTGLNDATIDIGQTNKRFKDLYLSGGVVFDTVSGNATSNTLDDYEEGTWTCQIGALGGGNDATQGTTAGYYTKIGRTVHCHAYVYNINLAAITSGNYIVIKGFPFNAFGYGDFTFAYKDGGWTNNSAIVGGYVQSGQSVAYLVRPDGSEAIQTGSYSLNRMMLNVVYQVA